jgi:hypothetical protein
VFVAIADLDGDTFPDLITASTGGLSVLRGNGDGRFQPPASFAAGKGGRSLATAHLDRDTFLDLVVANDWSNSVSVFSGNGDGSFEFVGSFGVGSYPASIAVADLDGDTVLDVVSANLDSHDVTVLLNLCDRAAGAEVDIRPWSEHNFVYPFSRLVIPVALFSSDAFDVADVDVTTLAFGPSGAAPAFDLTHAWVYWLSHWDVNGDGRKDLLSYYRTQETGISVGDTDACLNGETSNGIPFEGCDAVTTTSFVCGLGAELVLLLPPLMWLSGRRRLSLP